ncbi:hypothetical protein ACFUJ0_27800, partial [Streptomyces sp. NPDC057242]
MPDEAQPISAAQPDPKAEKAAPGTGTPQNKPAETGPAPAAPEPAPAAAPAARPAPTAPARSG